MRSIWEERASMRRSFLSGLVLAIAAVLVVVLGAAFDLELESVALLGAALGAVLALVPDRGPGVRLAGFGLGFVIAWVGYAARAALLPDTSSGRAVAVGLVVVLCTLVAALSGDRLPLWSVLLGTAALAGGYEFTYAAAPPELMDTSASTATTLLLTVGIGFLAASLVAPDGDALRTRPAPGRRVSDNTHANEIMESAK
jgi:hypothetical protein